MERKKQRELKTKSAKKSITRKPGDVSIFTILFIIIIIAMFIGICFGVRWLVITLKYKQYTDKMYDYGYEVLYNNEKATSTQEVTNIELVKVGLGVLKNKLDISDSYYKEKDINKNWINYAIDLGIIDNIELDAKATKIESVMYVTNIVEKVLGIEISKANLSMNKKALAKFTEDEQTIIAKAVSLGLIKNKTSVLSDKEIIKGELNKLVITLSEKYNTIYYKSRVFNDKEEVNIVTDKKLKPENYKEYPYIVDNIDKEVYELDYDILTEKTFKNPKETYKIMGYLYMQTDELITNYFDKILNVDYNKITIESFLRNIENDVTYAITEKDVEEYVNYVKTNKIKLEGKATPLLPIMYGNGEQYVVRTKIEFKVLNSDTNKNLIYGDDGITYNSKEITMYVDVPLGMTFNSNSLRIYVTPLARKLAMVNNNIVIEK